MEVPNIKLTSFQDGTVWAAMGDYFGCHSDQPAAIALAILAYLHDNYGLKELTVDGKLVPVRELLRGQDKQS